MNPISEHKTLLRYGVAILATGVALAAAVAFRDPVVRPYFLFIGAAVVASWCGGWRPGIVASLLGGLCGFFFIFLPEQSRTGGSTDSLAKLMAFLGTLLLVFAITSALHGAMVALQRSNLRFGGVVQLSEDAIITIDDDLRITLFNPGAEQIFGYAAREVLGKPLNVLLPERYRAIHDMHVGAFANSPDVMRPMNARGHIFGLRKNGAEFPAEASISKFEAGNERVMTVRLRDVSERIAAERGLRELAAIVEFSADAIVGENLEGVITSWNKGAEKIYGYPANEVIGRDVRFLLPPDRSDEIMSNLEKVRHGISSTTETVRIRADGKPVNIMLTISPIRDKNGNVVGASTVAHDITEQKRLEEQLRQSQKMEAIGRLAGGVAHDFNNLLSVIVGYAYLMRFSVEKGHPLANAAEQVMNAAEKAGALTRQLLAFSRRQVLQPEVIDLNDVVYSMEKMLPRLIGEDIDLQTVRTPGLKSVKADPGQLEQVIMNLVVNARDAMPEGGKLTIETANIHFSEEEAQHHDVAPGDYVMLAVSDTGYGMDEQTRAHMFEPFFTTKESGKGTGLGLATVYGIVNQSSGHIWVYSEPGAGTTFKIYLPAVSDTAERSGISQTPEFTMAGSETVLVVEDEDSLRALIVNVLDSKGYKVLSAASGAAALKIFKESHGEIDLLLTDVVMPGMRGQELAHQLLRHSPRLPVIYMSGYTDNALMHAGSLPEGTIFLQKPFTPDIVLRKVREVLDSTRENGLRRSA
ncbi:MAG: PAS domain S-box protein [Terriglobales bacterium]